MTRAHWLLDVEIDGAVYRWSDAALEVVNAEGDTLDYASGLGDLDVAQGQSGIGVEVLDPTVDWPTLAREIDGRRAILRRWVEGSILEQAEVYAFGEAVNVGFGGRTEPVSFAIEDVSGSEGSLGTQVPDVLARVDETTWPVDSGHVAGTGGGTYPVIFGFPGWTGVNPPIPVVPVPLAQWDGGLFAPATTYVVVSEDPDLPIAACRIRNDDLDVEGNETVVRRTDLLGRQVLVAHFTDDEAPFPESENATLFAGFTPAQGGGKRSAYDAVEYVLRKWGPETADWIRLPEVRDDIGAFMVDSWIDHPLPDPWAWIDDVLVPALLLEVRVSARGRYLVSRRFIGDGTRLVGSISVERGEAVRTSDVTRSGRPVNEFTGLYRPSRDGEWLGRVVLSGDRTVTSVPASGVVTPTATQVVTLATTTRCQESFARYRLRQSEDGPLELDWTWDTGTALRCLERRAERDAIPAFLVEYDVEDGEDLVEGDELDVSDAELGWASVRAIVEEPPVRGTATSVLLRVELP